MIRSALKSPSTFAAALITEADLSNGSEAAIATEARSALVGGYAFLLAAKGKFNEAVNVVEQSLLRDPASSLVVADTGHIYYLARRYDDAVHLLRRAEELDPTSPYPRSFEARSLRFAGRPAEALEAWLWKPQSSDQNKDFRQRYASAAGQPSGVAISSA